MSDGNMNVATTAKTRPELNVIVFGETGAGKSSVINMLGGTKTAQVSDRATGVTFSSVSYKKTIGDSSFQVFDTVGLNEGQQGLVAPQDAIEGLYRLIRRLEDGVSLLIYVMRASRIRSTTQKNYEMFHDVFCQKQVPIVIVVTGLETRDDMDEWWIENRMIFERYSMHFQGHACITATQGKVREGRPIYEEEYKHSRKKVETLILQRHKQDPWKMPQETWFQTVIRGIYNIFAMLRGVEQMEAEKELQVALRQYAEPLSRGAPIRIETNRNRIDVKGHDQEERRSKRPKKKRRGIFR